MNPEQPHNQVAEGSRFYQHPTIQPGHTFATVTDQISQIVLTHRTPPGWYLGFGIAAMVVGVLVIAISGLLWWGVGVWGRQ